MKSSVPISMELNTPKNKIWSQYSKKYKTKHFRKNSSKKSTFKTLCYDFSNVSFIIQASRFGIFNKECPPWNLHSLVVSLLSLRTLEAAMHTFLIWVVSKGCEYEGFQIFLLHIINANAVSLFLKHCPGSMI